MRHKLGICQWFHYQDFASVDRAAELAHELGVRHLRTGISWADYHRPQGKKWYDWQMKALREFEVLVSVWHTPPSIGEAPKCAAPPNRLEDYAGFIWQVIEEYGEHFTHLELWNEPNNRYKWDFENHDPDWSKFGRMIAFAAGEAKRQKKPAVLGGMIPVDHHWLNLIKSHGALKDIDIVAIHGFPEMWWPDQPNWEWHGHWKGWEKKVGDIAAHCDGRPVWITETGLATWDLDEAREGRFDLQADLLEAAASAPVDRVYWYSLIDLDPNREAIEGFHVDENEYHLGLVRFDGTKKPAFDRMKSLLAKTRIEPGRTPP